MDTIEIERASKYHGYSIMPKEKVVYGIPCGPLAVQLHIGHLPNRRGLCLYIAETNEFVAQITPLAYFKTKEAADRAQVVLDWLILRKEPTS